MTSDDEAFGGWNERDCAKILQSFAKTIEQSDVLFQLCFSERSQGDRTLYKVLVITETNKSYSKHNQGLKFVFVHNREEDFSRPTLPLSILEED